MEHLRRAYLNLNYSKSEDKAKEVLKEIQDKGGEAVIYKADVSVSKEVNNMVEDVMGIFGKIDILVNNAGITDPRFFLDIKEEGWNRMINIHLKGTFNCCGFVVPHMIKMRKEGLKGAYIRLHSYHDEIEFLKGQLETIDKNMEELLKKIDIAEYLLSILGIGIITVAGFLTEGGDLANYSHFKQIQKLAGLNIAENQSRKHKGKAKNSKRGRPELRNLLHKSSLTLVAKNKEFKALYNYFLKRPKNPLKAKQALIAISVKLVRVMFALAKKRENYDPQKVLGEYRMMQINQLAA
ncbi:MAG: ISChy2, transposase [Caldanaerobacter subterraneus]|uniref:SDR family NAD(P)-dependent oxidoreductase n=1 Tax=Caldanaerobacter subterraneus TaxID=911092 RepID=UPI0007476D05|nr:SDR family NAD(P)-dependent oxidoreductase [Caldanaerobacter subterraneus]KUK07935.1 MAG: ISChy2, transposase [Caldanaerobacter subterraneus]